MEDHSHEKKRKKKSLNVDEPAESGDPENGNERKKKKEKKLRHFKGVAEQKPELQLGDDHEKKSKKEKKHKKAKTDPQHNDSGSMETPDTPASAPHSHKLSQTPPTTRPPPPGGYSKNSARKKKKRDKRKQMKLDGTLPPSKAKEKAPKTTTPASKSNENSKPKTSEESKEKKEKKEKKDKKEKKAKTEPHKEKNATKERKSDTLPSFLSDLNTPPSDALRQVQRECHQAGIRRDLIAFNKMISQYGQRKLLPLALEVYKQLSKTKLVPTVFTFTNLVNACVRCGEMERACQVLEEMKVHSVRPNEVTFTALIKGFCQDGDMQAAAQALENMKSHGTKPNLRTYNTVLRGCWRAGAVALAQKMFAEMRKSNVAADVSAFEYLVKTLAQSMKIADAWKIIEEMKSKNIEHSPAYSALATACALQGDAAGARKALLAAEQHIDKMQLLYQHSNEGDEEGYHQYEVGDGGGYNNQQSFSKDNYNQSSDNSHGRERASLPLFLRLRIEELKKECDRVRAHLTAAPNGAPPRFGLFPNSERVVIVPSPAQGTAAATATPPASKPIDIASMFGNTNPTRLEVCAGHGDWIVDRAQRDQTSNWMALEMRFERIYQIWGKMIFKGVPNLAAICGEAHHTVRERFANSCLEEVFINFPDPPVWEGSKQRLISKSFLEQIHRILKPEAMLTILTDDEGYANQVAVELNALTSIFKSQFGAKPFINTVPDNYGVTSYFDRMWLNGQRTKRFYFRFQKI